MPMMILETYLHACFHAARAGGLAIRDLPRDQAPEVRNAGGRANIAPEMLSQREILSVLRRLEPDANFVTNAKVDGGFMGRVLGAHNFELMASGRTYMVDGLGGANMYNAGRIGLYDWTTSVGLVNSDLEHTRGAIFAPEIWGGTMFYASKGSGAFAISEDKGEIPVGVSGTTNLRKARVVFDDASFREGHLVNSRAITEIAGKARTIKVSGPCSLGLGLAAIGSLDAVVQSAQRPAVYAAGKTIIEEAGGVFLPYAMQKSGRLVPIGKLGLEHYNPEKKVVGFIAGNRELAESLMDILVDKN